MSHKSIIRIKHRDLDSNFIGSSLEKAQRLPLPFLAFRLFDLFPNKVYESLVREYEFFRKYVTWHNNGLSETIAIRNRNSITRLTFITPETLSGISKIIQQKVLPYSETGFQYYAPNQDSGQIHHDYTYVRIGRMSRTHYPEIYFTKQSNYARIFTLIYYLRNDWATEHSDGGTELYGLKLGQKENPFSLLAYVPPVNNSALLFECTPDSFHRFFKTTHERCSIVNWGIAKSADTFKKYGIRPTYYETSVEETLRFYRALGSVPNEMHMRRSSSIGSKQF